MIGLQLLRSDVQYNGFLTGVNGLGAYTIKSDSPVRSSLKPVGFSDVQKSSNRDIARKVRAAYSETHRDESHWRAKATVSSVSSDVSRTRVRSVYQQKRSKALPSWFLYNPDTNTKETIYTKKFGEVFLRTNSDGEVFFSPSGSHSRYHYDKHSDTFIEEGSEGSDSDIVSSVSSDSGTVETEPIKPIRPPLDPLVAAMKIQMKARSFIAKNVVDEKRRDARRKLDIIATLSPAAASAYDQFLNKLKPLSTLMKQLDVTFVLKEDGALHSSVKGRAVSTLTIQDSTAMYENVKALLKNVHWESLAPEDKRVLLVTGAQHEVTEQGIGYSFDRELTTFTDVKSFSTKALKPKYAAYLDAARRTGHTVKFQRNAVQLSTGKTRFRPESVGWDLAPRKFESLLRRANKVDEVTDTLDRHRTMLHRLGFSYAWDNDTVVFKRAGEDVARIKSVDVNSYVQSLTSQASLMNRLSEIVNDYFLPLKHKLTFEIVNRDVVFKCKSNTQSGHHHHHHHHHHGDHHDLGPEEGHSQTPAVRQSASHVMGGSCAHGCTGHSHMSTFMMQVPQDGLFCQPVGAATSVEESLSTTDDIEDEIELAGGDEHVFKVPVDDLLPLLAHDIEDGVQSSEIASAKLKLISLLAPHAINEFSEESGRLPVPSDGYDEAALFFKSSGISDHLLWFINLGIFAGGTYALGKYGIGHVIEHIGELKHGIEHLDEDIKSLNQQKNTILERNYHIEALRRPTESDIREKIDNDKSLSKLAESLEEKEAERADLAEDLRDHYVEMVSLSSMAGGTFSGVIESIGLAVKTFNSGSVAATGEAIMEISEIASHMLLGLGSVLSIYTGYKSLQSSYKEQRALAKDVEKLESSKASLLAFIRQKNGALTSMSSGSEKASQLRAYLDELNNVVRVFDDVIAMTQDEGDFRANSLKLRGVCLMAGGAILGAYNAGHVLAELGGVTFASGFLEGPLGLASMAIGVTMVIVGVSASLILEFRESKQRMMDHAENQLIHDFNRQIGFMKGLLDSADVEDASSYFEEYAQAYAGRARRKADDAWITRKQVQAQIGHPRGRFVQKTHAQLNDYVRAEANIGHFEVSRLYPGRIQPGTLSLKGVDIRSQKSPLLFDDVYLQSSGARLSDQDKNIYIWTKYLAHLNGENFDSSIETGDEDIADLLKTIIMHLKDTGVLDETVYGLAHYARSTKVSAALDRLGIRQRTFSPELRARLRQSGLIKTERMKTEDKRRWYNAPARGVAFVGNALNSAKNWMGHGVKRACRMDSKPPGWSRYWNDTDRKGAQLVSYYDVGVLLSRLESNSPDVMSKEEMCDVLEALKITYFSSHNIDLMQRGFCLASRNLALDVRTRLLDLEAA